MPFIITNGTDYVKRKFDGKYTSVSNETLADRWDDRNKASKVLGSSLPAKLKRGYRVVEIQDDPPITQKVERENSTQKLSTEQFQGNLADFLATAQALTQHIGARSTELHEMQGKADREVSDILHYIEFNSLNACQGFKAYKMLREVLLKRRGIKDEMQFLSSFQNTKISADDIGKLVDEVNNPRQKIYTPRELPQLFEGK